MAWMFLFNPRRHAKKFVVVADMTKNRLAVVGTTTSPKPFSNR